MHLYVHNLLLANGQKLRTHLLYVMEELFGYLSCNSLTLDGGSQKEILWDSGIQIMVK